MQKVFGLVLLLAGVASTGSAGAIVVPEIDPAAGGSAVAFIAGAILVIRARRKK